VSDLSAVGVAANCDETLTPAGEVEPELILMYPNIPGTSGI